MVDGVGGVVELVLQSGGNHRPAQGLGGAQGDLLRVGDRGLGRDKRVGGGGGGRDAGGDGRGDGGIGGGGVGGGRDGGGGRGGGGAGLSRGGGLALGVGWQTKGRGGLQVPATTLPPARHIWRKVGKKRIHEVPCLCESLFNGIIEYTAHPK